MNDKQIDLESEKIFKEILDKNFKEAPNFFKEMGEL